MTSTTYQSATGIALPAVISRHWRLLALAVVGLGPFLPSIWAMRSFAFADNVLGFTPFALVAAVYLFWVRAHHDDRPTTRDVFTDVFVILPLVGITLFILYVTPARMSWYFWLNRMDLAALAPWATAVALVFIGYQQVLRTWPTWAMLFLVWPYPMVALQRAVSDLFVSITAAVAGWSVDFLRLPFVQGAVDHQTFTTDHLPQGENFTLIVGQLCSGTASTLGFVVVGLGLMLMSHGSEGRRVSWLLLGTALAFALNLLRVVVLLTVAGKVDRDIAVHQVHPLLGLFFFVLLIVVMLLLMRSFGLRFDPMPRGRSLVWRSVKGGGRPLVALSGVITAVSLLVTAGVVQAQELNFIGIGDGVPAIAVEDPRTILPDVDGWELEHQTRISWTDLFGRTSRGDVFVYRAPAWDIGDPAVSVQTVVTEDKATLERYTIEQCVDFHRRDLEARQAVDLGHGVTGILLHHTEEGVLSSILYWVIPVNVDDEIRHARIALFGDLSSPTFIGELDDSQRIASPATARFGQALETAMDGQDDASEDVLRAEMDLGLAVLASQMVDTLVQTGGPAVEAGIVTRP